MCGRETYSISFKWTAYEGYYGDVHGEQKRGVEVYGKMQINTVYKDV